MKVDVETIRARADAATPGPWEQRENRDEGHGVSTVDPLWPGRGHDIVCLGSDGLFADLVFIAHARADVPALCGASRRRGGRWQPFGRNARCMLMSGSCARLIRWAPRSWRHVNDCAPSASTRRRRERDRSGGIMNDAVYIAVISALLLLLWHSRRCWRRCSHELAALKRNRYM